MVFEEFAGEAWGTIPLGGGGSVTQRPTHIYTCMYIYIYRYIDVCIYVNIPLSMFMLTLILRLSWIVILILIGTFILTLIPTRILTLMLTLLPKIRAKIVFNSICHRWVYVFICIRKRLLQSERNTCRYRAKSLQTPSSQPFRSMFIWLVSESFWNLDGRKRLMPQVYAGLSQGASLCSSMSNHHTDLCVCRLACIMNVRMKICLRRQNFVV